MCCSGIPTRLCLCQLADIYDPPMVIDLTTNVAEDPKYALGFGKALVFYNSNLRYELFCVLRSRPVFFDICQDYLAQSGRTHKLYAIVCVATWGALFGIVRSLARIKWKNLNAPRALHLLSPGPEREWDIPW